MDNTGIGIGATRKLDQGPGGDPEGGQEQCEADALACQADVQDAYLELHEPSCIAECPRWGDNEIGRMVRMYCAGMPVADIAASVGEPLQAVGYELAEIRHGMDARKTSPGEHAGRRPPVRLTDEQVDTIIRMRVVEKRTLKEIAKAVGVASSTVRYVAEGEHE